MKRLINTHAQAERSAFAMHAGLNARPPPAAAIAVVAKEASQVSAAASSWQSPLLIRYYI